MSRLDKIVIACLSAIGVLILGVVIFWGTAIFMAKRTMWQAENYILALSDTEMQQWIARTETILNDNENTRHTFDDLVLPDGVRKPLTYYFREDHIVYHWCMGIACADLIVTRLPEGGHEIMFRGQRLYPKEPTTGNNP